MNGDRNKKKGRRRMNRIQNVILRKKTRAKLLKMMITRKSRNGAIRTRTNALMTIGKISQKEMTFPRNLPKVLRNQKRRIRLVQPGPNRMMLQREEAKRIVVEKEERTKILMKMEEVSRHLVPRSLLNREGR